MFFLGELVGASSINQQDGEGILSLSTGAAVGDGLHPAAEWDETAWSGSDSQNDESEQLVVDGVRCNAEPGAAT